MTTRLLLTCLGPSGEEPASHVVTETFDEVLEKIWPLTSPSTALEGRAKHIYTKTNGARVAIHPNLIGTIEEHMEEE